MKNRQLLFILLLSVSSAQAQVAGISASKLNTINAEPISKGALELEPTFSSSRSSAVWGVDGLDELGNTSVSSSICWRVTHGISDGIEVGLSIPSDFSSGSLGLKTILSAKDIFSLGAMIGISTPFGNRNFNQDNRAADDLTSYGIGLIGSWIFSSVSSLDANIQYQDYFNTVGAESPSGILYNVDYGHYIAGGKFQLFVGAGYQTASADGFSANVFSLFPGISVETSDKYMLVLNTQHDLFGKNAEKTIGLNLAVTTMW